MVPYRANIRVRDVTSNLGVFEIPFNISEVYEVTHFVARKAELDRIGRVLTGRTGRRIAVVQGLGGIGKTQLSIAYLRSHRDEYTAILWLNARDESTLKQSYLNTARWILRYHPDNSYISSALDSRDSNEVVNAVKQWLEEPMNVSWLIVYDNHDHPLVEGHTLGEDADENGNGDEGTSKAFSLRTYLPQTDHGAIIVTSRSTEVNLGQLIRVGKLEDIGDCLKVLAPASECDALRSGLFLPSVCAKLLM